MVSRRRIGKREIAALGAGQVIWDGELPGFGARRQRSEAVTYVLLYRNAEGRQRWHTIGRHGAPWTPETARREAVKLLGTVAGGVDPAMLKRAKRDAKTVSELCDLYLQDAESGRLLTRRKQAKKASTLVTDRGRIERHIKPLLGKRTVASVTQQDVDGFLHDVASGKTATRKPSGKARGLINVRGGRGTASRTVGLLGAIFGYAVRHRMRNDNPVRGVERWADGRRNVRLANDHYPAIAKALNEAKAKIWPNAVAATRFLLLTGWRRGEALGLQWSEVDLDRRTAVLGDTKTGLSVRPLSNAACDILRAQATLTNRTGFVFPSMDGGALGSYPKQWASIAALGKLPDTITPHVLRHSFASVASDLEYSEATIATLLGHRRGSTTSRYIHAADAVVLAAADAIAGHILELMGERADGRVVKLTVGRRR